MCAGCIDVVSLIHDETYVADSDIGKLIMKSIKDALYTVKRVEVSDSDIGTFMIVMGGQLLNWEAQ